MPEDSSMLALKFDDEILTVKTFIACVDTGKYKFVKPEKEDLDFEAEDNFQLRVSMFRKHALKWLDLYQTIPLSKEFKELTKELHSKILNWRLQGLVIGEQALSDTFAENMLMRHENRKIVEMYENLRAENIQLAEEIAKFRRPPIINDEETSEIKGEE
jgi:hypothetical protein